jgi:hypothetical protein
MFPDGRLMAAHHEDGLVGRLCVGTSPTGSEEKS